MIEQRSIIAAVCRQARIRESQLLSPSRVYPLVAARMLAILLMARRGFTDERISWALNRERVTITCNRHKAENELATNPDFARRYESLKISLDNGEPV